MIRQLIRRFVRHVAPGFALAAAIAAQSPTITATALQPLGVFADAPGNAADVHVVPAQTTLSPSFSLVASSGSSTASFDVTTGATSARCTITGHADSPGGTTTGGTCVDPTPTPGPIQLEVRFSAPVPMSCRLIATLSGSTGPMPNGTASATVTVRVAGTGGTWDTSWTSPLQIDTGVTIDPTGVPVQIDMEGVLAAVTGDYRATVDLQLVPDAIVRSYGTSCATLTARPFGTSLYLQVHSSIQLGRAALLLGTKPLQQPLPFSGCNALVEPLLILGGYRTGIDGNANISLRLPRGPLQLQIQGVAADANVTTVETTDGLDVVIPF